MKRIKPTWPKGPLYWDTDSVDHGHIWYISVTFTWKLPAIREALTGADLFTGGRIRVGGPAVDLMPEYLAGIPGVEVGGSLTGVLQRANPLATRTTIGCPRHCAFCGIGQGRIEPGGFRELEDWPNLPVVCDNNLLAASEHHIERVCRDLRETWGWADFNQGLDARLVTPENAREIASIGRPHCRLALDSGADEAWNILRDALDRLRAAGIPKSLISVYALIGWLDSPMEAWARCQNIEHLGYQALPMWYHRLDALEVNEVTLDQRMLGWTEDERKGIMGWYYHHRRQSSLRSERRSAPEAVLEWKGD